MYNGRTIREAMKEAHENVDNYGGKWFVCSDEFKSVVKESYFITDEGDRKVKPFTNLYNTEDMKYGYHTVQWVEGEIVIDSDDRAEHRFTQPYDRRFVEEQTHLQKTRSIGMTMLGDPHVGRSHAMAQALSIARIHDRLEDDMVMPMGDLIDKFKERGIDIKTAMKPFIIDDPYKYTRTWDWDNEPFIIPKRFDMATGKFVEETHGGGMSEAKRKALRKKRKK